VATRGVSGQVLEQFRRNRNTVRFCVKLGVYSVIAFSALYVLQDQVVQPFTRGIAWVTYILMRAVNTPVTLDGVDVRVPNFGVSIQNNCNAIYEMGLFVAAALAYPASARRRIAGIAFAVVVLYVVNLIRVLSLVYTGYLMPGFFEAAHVYVWQVLFLVVLGALWLGWISWIRPVA
jgi:exosortase/archaeosortase family protein